MLNELVPTIASPLPGAALVRLCGKIVVAAVLDTLVVGNLAMWFWIGVRISG